MVTRQSSKQSLVY